MGYRLIVSNRVAPDEDPRGGFFGDLFHAVTHVVGGAISGLASGGPVGGIVGAVAGTASAISEAAGSNSGGSDAGVPPTPMLPPPSAMGATGGAMVPAGAVISPLGTVGGSGARAKLAAGQAKGYHMNKSWGFSMKTKQIRPPNSHLVRNRRMNWGNHKALSRAGRRIHAFLHHARRFYSMAHPHHKGTMAFKFKRGKKR